MWHLLCFAGGRNEFDRGFCFELYFSFPQLFWLDFGSAASADVLDLPNLGAQNKNHIWCIQRKPTNRRNFGFQTLITFYLWELWKNRKYVKCSWGYELFDDRNFWVRRIFYECRIFYMSHTVKSTFSRFFTKSSV